jgi:hypothetical protein
VTGWQLTRGLQNLRAQVNEAFPNRDRTSDGTIGDQAHQAEVSGHNPDDTAGSRPAWNGDGDSTPEVRAWDMDNDLAPGFDCQMLVDHTRRLPGVASVLRYMIYNRWMYHERDGFAPTPYTGSSAHTEHVHFEGAWSQAADENTTFDYKFEEIPVALTAADKTWITGQINAAVSKLESDNTTKVDDLLSVKIGDAANKDRTVGDVLRDTAKLRGYLVGDPGDTRNAAIPATAPVVRTISAADAVQAVAKDVAALKATVEELTQRLPA